MSESRNPFRQLGKQNKVVLAFVLGSVLFLSTLTPVLSVPILPSSPFLLTAAAATQNSTSSASDDNNGKPDGNEKPDDRGKPEDKEKFSVVEATISDIHNAIKTNQVTCTEVVQQYIDRAKAYNGVCTMLTTEDGEPIDPAFGRTIVGSPQVFPTETVPVSSILPDLDEYVGLPLDLGRMETSVSDPDVQQQMGMRVGISDAGQLNALETLNIRGERSVTCQGEFDAHPSTGPLSEGAPEVCEEFRQQPDALEMAAELDEQYGSNPPLDELPMYCVAVAAKDPYDTKDMRTAANNDVDFAMDAPPFDATLIAELREKGAIIYAKAQAHEFNAGPGNPGGPNEATTNLVGEGYAISTWSGQSCNPYDTERVPRGSSSGSGVAVAANLATVAICEQTFASCQGPASRNGLVNILATTGVLPDSGGIGNQFFVDRPGIYGKTVGDAARVLDAIKDPQRGYFDPRNIYTALPKPLIPDEPYASFVIDEVTDEGPKSKPLEGMRVGIIREFMVKHTPNDVAISDQIDNEIKAVLRDQLGAELVESVDPRYGDDPDVPDMTYTFADAFSETLPRHIPEIFSRTDDSGNLLFAVPGHNVTSYDYLLALSNRQAPLSDAIRIDTIANAAGFPNALTFKFEIERYLVQRGDERVTDWASWVENAKFRQDASRAGAENWVLMNNTVSEGKSDRFVMSDTARLAVLKVMYENDIDVLVNPENTIPPNKIGGPIVGSISCCGALTALLQIPQIVVPAGFTQIVYEPQFALSEDRTDYDSVAGTEQSLLPNPMPISMMFWAGPGDDPTLLKVASAYEAATHHRAPPPDFSGPLPDITPITEHMPAPTASAGYGVYDLKPARAEYVTEDSQLVGDKIDSITLKLKRVHTVEGTAEIGVLNEDLSVKKLFGTLDVSTLTQDYMDYEFTLTNGEPYTIEAGDRIGIKYDGSTGSNWISVMLDLDPEDPFDGANSYLQYHYQDSWRHSPDRDMYMVLKQAASGPATATATTTNTTTTAAQPGREQ